MAGKKDEDLSNGFMDNSKNPTPSAAKEPCPALQVKDFNSALHKLRGVAEHSQQLSSRNIITETTRNMYQNNCG